jgi:hypothetical protein
MALALVAAPACAEVTHSGPDGFVSMNRQVVARSPAEVWKAVLAWGRWWDPAHSYSEKPGGMVLDPRAGGLLAENFADRSVAHATVVHVRPPELLRLNGGFGPLQMLPANAVLDIALKPEGTGTRITLSYRVGGPAFAKLDELAEPVDGVMTAAFGRLVRYVNTGNPEETR